MNNCQNQQKQQREAELEKIKKETPFRQVQPGNGWGLCFMFEDGEIYTPAIISFIYEGSHNDFQLTFVTYWDKDEKRIKAVIFDDFGEADASNLVGLLEPGQRISRELKKTAEQKNK